VSIPASERRDLVGPVLQAGADGRSLLRALEELNEGLCVEDRGAYLRVLVPGRCVLTRAAVERHSARAWRFPGDLECNMPAFKGFFSVTADEACWSWERP
jgi:hypothetical protein